MKRLAVWITLAAFLTLGISVVQSGIRAQEPARPLPENVILLQLKIFNLDQQRLTKSGIAFGELLQGAPRAGGSVASPATAMQSLSVVNPREAKLIEKLLTASGAAQVVAEPSLWTTDGRQATVHAGGELPIRRIRKVGPPIAFADIGTKVEIEPKLLADHTRVRLDLTLKHSTIDHTNSAADNGPNLPTLSTQTLDTTLEIEFGKTAVLLGGASSRLLVMITPEIDPARVASQSPGEAVVPKVAPRAVPATNARSVQQEIRELQNDVRGLRRDVKRLIELLETRSDQAESKRDTHSGEHASPESREQEPTALDASWDLTLGEAIELALRNAQGNVLEQASPRGLVVPRPNAEVSSSEDAMAARNRVSDVEESYWRLWSACQDLETNQQARRAAHELWKETVRQIPQGMANNDSESAAREQFFSFRARVERSRHDLVQHENTLRMVLGIAASDGRLIRPCDAPPTSNVRFDWQESLRRMLAGNAECMRLRQALTEDRAQLAATQKQLAATQAQLAKAGFRFEGTPVSGTENTDYLAFVGQRRELAGIRHLQLKIARTDAVLKELERSSTYALTAAFRDEESRYAELQAREKQRTAARSDWEAARAGNDGGKADLAPLLDLQRRLAQSELDHHAALSQYAIAVKNVHLRQGTLLEARHVSVANEEM